MSIIGYLLTREEIYIKIYVVPTIKKVHSSKNSTLTFYVFHLPILMLLIGILASSALVTSKLTSKTFRKSSTEQSFGYVLGDDSDEDDDKEDDKNEDREDNEDDDDQENKENENELEQEEDDDNDDGKGERVGENKIKTQQRVQNSDGTYYFTKTETEGNKVKIETKTYDASGKLLKEEKHEGDDEGFESETENSSGNKLKIRVQDTEALIKREGVTGLDNFPLYLDENDGSVYVETPNGQVKLGVMPQSIIEKAEDLDTVDSVEDVELESETEDKLEFKLKTKSAEKLFGIFNVEIPATLYFDAQNGEQLRSEQTFMNKVLSFFSF